LALVAAFGESFGQGGADGVEVARNTRHCCDEAVAMAVRARASFFTLPRGCAVQAWIQGLHDAASRLLRLG
jgi:hypothetical protein